MHTDSKSESQLQLSPDGKLRHLLTLKDLEKNIIHNILQQADKFSQSNLYPIIKKESLKIALLPTYFLSQAHEHEVHLKWLRNIFTAI